jgi:hypothetical protein
MHSVFFSSSRGADLARRSEVIQPCKEVHGPPAPSVVWSLTPMLGYFDENGNYQVQGVTYSVKKESETWGFGADMVYTLITRFDPYDDYILSVNGTTTDGTYYVSIERTHQSVIRRFYISHTEECRFKPKYPAEMLDIYAVWINQYEADKQPKKDVKKV